MDKPIYINIDHSVIPGHVVLTKEDWGKVLDYFKQTTEVKEFFEDQNVFVDHQQGTCDDDCSICGLGILFHERSKYEAN